MDDAFLLDDVARPEFIRSVMHSFGCTYLCLWSYLPPPHNCLLFWDGSYHELQHSHPSSSSGSLTRILFDKYCQSLFPVADFDCVPGLAFKNGQQYLELHEPELQRLVSNETQRRFYREARIKTAVFMGCKTGEIEFGMSNSTQINMEMEMRNLFPKEYFSAGSQSLLAKDQIPPPQTDLNRHSSSSSSLRSIDSPEYSPLIYQTNPNISQIITTQPLNEDMNIPSSSFPPSIPITTSSSSSNNQPHLQDLLHQAFAQIRTVHQHPQLPIKASEVDAAMTRAILAVLTSSPTSSSSSSHQHQHQQQHLRLKPSAFKTYSSALAPSSGGNNTGGSQMVKGAGQSMMKRATSFYRRLNIARRQHMVGATRPTSTQLHHMISERRRREKLNESFQALRSLLPPGTKRDKASLLISTRDHLSTLKTQISELRRRNQELEAQLLPPSATKEAEAAAGEQQPTIAYLDQISRYEVQITPVAESTSEQGRIINLGVIVRGECGNMLDLVIRLLEFLKQASDVSLVSMEADTRVAGSSSFNNVVFRLKIEESEWDESAFEEAVRRVVADLAQ